MAAIYQADVWCDDCARHICRKIHDAKDALIGGMDESAYDSDEYPKYYDEDTEESDCPQHCAGCGDFLENPLTTDGADYVKDAVIEAIESGHDDSVALTEWFPYYDWIDWGTIGQCYNCGKWSVELGPDECSDCSNTPRPDDYTITPCGSLGGRSALAVVEGRFIGEFDSDDDAIAAARAIMEAERYWPEIWIISDHGNVTLVREDD